MKKSLRSTGNNGHRYTAATSFSSSRPMLVLAAVLLVFALLQAPSRAAPGQPGKPFRINSSASEGFERDRILEFMWNDVPNVSFYNIYMSTNGGIHLFAGTTRTNTFTVNCNDGMLYSVQVAGVDTLDQEGQKSAASPPVRCDITQPSMVRHDPINGAREVPADSDVTVTFSEAMNVTSLYMTGTVKLYEGGKAVESNLSYDIDEKNLLISAKGGYRHGIKYTVEIGVSATDLAGNPLKDLTTFTFTTEMSERLSIDRVLAYPSPADRRGTSLTYVLSQNVEEVVVEIYHVGGDRVRVYDDAPISEGYNERFWDLRNNDGKEVPNGLYYFRVVAKSWSTGTYLGASKFQKLLVLK